MKRLFLFLALALALSAHAQTQIPAPAGWTTQTRGSGAQTFTPPDLGSGEIYSVTLYGAAALGNRTLEAYLRDFAGPVGTGAGRLVNPLKMQRLDETQIVGAGVYAGPNGALLAAVFRAVSLDGETVHISRTLVSRQNELIPRYKNESRALDQALMRRAQLGATKIVGASSKKRAPKVSPKKSGPLAPASLGGAKVFLKHSWTYFPTLQMRNEHLLLFPDGTAFDDFPTTPLASWSAASIRRALHPNRVGKWKMSGQKIVLTFPDADNNRTLTRTARGWADPSGMRMNGENYNVYFSAIAAPKTFLLGAWENKTLSVSGTLGGAAPMVAGGSDNTWNFRADGTFSDGRKSFASATTANMSDAFKTGGDVTMSSQGEQSGRGKWRLDGPLLTLEKNGQRTVHLAFLLAKWNDSKSHDLLVDGDFWSRPRAR